MKRPSLTAALVFAMLCTWPLLGAAEDLHLYTWADYIKPELVARFEKEQKSKVVIDTFDSNEAMYAKLSAGAKGYDLITPSSYMAKLMYAQGLLQDLDLKQIPNHKNVDPTFLKLSLDPSFTYSLPYMITYTGLGYLKSRVKDFQASWASLERPELKGRVTMLNDMRETFGAALKALGYSLNTVNEAEINAAKDLLLKWKKNLAKFENEQYKVGLGSGEFLLVHGYSGDILKSKEDNDDIEFAIPEQGFSVASDDFVIPKSAKAVKLAHAFINFLHQAQVAAENTEFITYLCPNQPSYQHLSEETKANPGIFPSAELLAKGEVIRDLGADNAKYIKAWDAVKAGG